MRPMRRHRRRGLALFLCCISACAAGPRPDETESLAVAIAGQCNVLAPTACSGATPACHPAATSVATCVREGDIPPGSDCSTPGVAGACTAGAVCDVSGGPARCLALCDVQHPGGCASGTCAPSQLYSGF